MWLPRWGHLAIWLIFAGVVYLPFALFGFDQFREQGLPGYTALRELFLAESQLSLLATSVLLASGTTALAVLIGVPYAFLCERTNVRGRSVFSLIYLLPLFLPPFLHAMVWSRLLAVNGPVNSFLIRHLQLESAPLDINNMVGALFVLALAYFPFVTLLTLSGLRTVERDYEEAAVLHRSELAALFNVALPMVRPQIMAGALFVFVFSIIDFGVPDIFRVRVFPVEIFIQFSALYDERAAVLLSLPLLLITILVISLQVRAMRGRIHVALGAGWGGSMKYPLGSWNVVAAFFCSLVIGLSVVVPVLALLWEAGPLDTYLEAVEKSYEQIMFSIGLSALAALMMIILAYFVALSIWSARGGARTLMEYFSQIPFAIPSIVLGVGLIKVWNRPETDWLYGTPLILVLGYVAHFVPFAIRAIYSNMQQISPTLIEAAKLSSGSGLAINLRIQLPLLWNGLITGFFIVFVLVIGELGITLLVTPPGTTTMPIKIYNYMHYGAESTVAALSLILLALEFLVAAGLFVLLRNQPEASR